tara:strand:- start:1282 stop:1755 length:474 start_codon:yes stop_codon:yes gene_type:complete
MLNINLLKKCNYVEIFIGSQNQNHFCCDISKDKFDYYLNKFSTYNKCKHINIKKYYKNLVLESEDKTNLYYLSGLKYETNSNMLVNYYNKNYLNKIEFPCKKSYYHTIYESGLKIKIDETISIYFNYKDNMNIKIIIDNTNNNLDVFKIKKIIELFT